MDDGGREGREGGKEREGGWMMEGWMDRLSE